MGPAGFANTSLDLIYGTPGEFAVDWMESLDAALSVAPEHISVYALIVEEGTRLAARIRRGELPPPDDDDLAHKYLIADERFASGRARREKSFCVFAPSRLCVKIHFQSLRL